MEKDEDLTIDLPTRIERRRKALKVSELASLIGVSDSKIYEFIQQGHLEAYRLGGAVRLDPASVAKWLRANRA